MMLDNTRRDRKAGRKINVRDIPTERLKVRCPPLFWSRVLGATRGCVGYKGLFNGFCCIEREEYADTSCDFRMALARRSSDGFTSFSEAPHYNQSKNF